jgi:hypothetical protein
MEGLLYVGTDDGLVQVTPTAEELAQDREVPGHSRHDLCEPSHGFLAGKNTVYAA